MCVKLSYIESFADLETGRALEAMNRLRIGIAIGIKYGFRDICDCSHSENVLPINADTTPAHIRIPRRCASIFFSRKEMIRLFEDTPNEKYYALIRDAEGIIEGRSFSESESNELVKEVLSSRFGADPVILKNLAMLQLLQEICHVEN